MKNMHFKKMLSVILCLVLFAAIALTAVGCGKKDSSAAPAAVSTVEDGATLGEGKTEFTFTVTDADGKESSFTINTDEETVGAALLGLGLIDGEDGEYGLYVKTVNGITADYDKDGTYWAFYVGDEYAMTGVDSTAVEAGAVYSFKVEKG